MRKTALSAHIQKGSVRMKKIRLGKTDLWVSRSSFGAIPIQRISSAEAAALLRSAYDAGINFFDTARMYNDSESKLAAAFGGMRQDVYIASKTMAKDTEGFWKDLEFSLRQLKSDYIDLYQLHNPSFVPVPGGGDGLYDALVSARDKGMIRHIGFTNHAQALAAEAVRSGLYETLQFPFSCLSDASETALVHLCEAQDVGFIAMKALAGGLMRDIRANFSYISTFPNVVTIWGLEKQCQLDEFLALEAEAPAYDAPMQQSVAKERADLGGEFCRGCGYCLPCPAGIKIPFAMRMDKLLARMLAASFTTPQWRADMELIDGCTECGVCGSRCPYHLKPYEVLKNQLLLYRDFCSKL
jgi:uncharacterized protein